MNEVLNPSLELTLKLTTKEANLLRLAMSKASSTDESKQAGKMLFRSLRERGARYTIAELQYDRANKA